jgi:hypothetical protein
MARISSRAAALAVAASLLFACADARADAGAAPPDSTVGGAEQSSSPDIPAASIQAEGATVAEGSLEGGAMGAQQESVGSQQQPQPPADASPVQELGPASGPTPPGPTAPGAPEETAPDPPVEPLGAAAASASEPSGGAQSHVGPNVALSPFEPGPIGGGRAPSGSQPLGSGLEPVLGGVERELRSVQSQIDNLQRRLDSGAAAPRRGLIRLRSSLERIAPVLAALEVRLRSAGPLGPRLRMLHRRLRARAAGARASARDLVAALRRSSWRGYELRLLLWELASFRRLEAGPASNEPARAALARSGRGDNAAYTETQPAPAVTPTPPHTATAPLERRAAGRPAIRPRGHGGDGPHPPRSSSTSASATASPGGALSAAGAGLMATLLIALAAPRLWARLALAAGHRPTVAFLSPLERPG